MPVNVRPFQPPTSAVATAVRPQAATPHPLSAALDRALERSRGPNLGGAVGVYQEGQGEFLGATGHTDPARNKRLDPNAKFKIGSITKTFVAVRTLQLVEEGKLKLDDPISKFLPDFPNGKQITVRQLLGHTSGLRDYLESPAVKRDITKPWTDDRLIEAAAQQKPTGRPGSGFDYSNTNYLLLGKILEQAGGAPLEQQLRKNILERLDMGNTFFEGREKVSPGLVRGSAQTRSGGFRDSTDDEHPTVAGASGAMVSNTTDLLRFFRGLFGGKLLKQSSLDAMTTPSTKGGDYGLGLSIEQSPWGPRYFHSGSIPGFNSDLSYLPSHGLFVAALSNTQLVEGEQSPADRLLEGVDRTILP